MEADYDYRYTPEELSALATALQAGNMEMSDLGFDKDYAQGYECFPIIREMMDDPLKIASWMDEFVANSLPVSMTQLEKQNWMESHPNSSMPHFLYFGKLDESLKLARHEFFRNSDPPETQSLDLKLDPDGFFAKEDSRNCYRVHRNAQCRIEGTISSCRRSRPEIANIVAGRHDMASDV